MTRDKRLLTNSDTSRKLNGSYIINTLIKQKKKKRGRFVYEARSVLRAYYSEPRGVGARGGDTRGSFLSQVLAGKQTVHIS